MPTGQDLVQLARRHLGEAYTFGAKVPKNNPQWKGPWDCAEFASWCVFQLTQQLFGCRPSAGNPDVADAFTGFWVSDATTQRCLVTVGEAVATRGAFLLRAPQANVIGHVAISLGDGSTLEAHSTATGVIQGTVNGRRWSTGVLVPGIAVDLAAPVPPRRPALVLRVTTPPMSGELVKAVQRALRDLGIHAGRIDGVYGPQTAAAVTAFQSARQLVADGEVGARTAALLRITWPT